MFGTTGMMAPNPNGGAIQMLPRSSDTKIIFPPMAGTGEFSLDDFNPSSV